jgi:hypothetical protein
MRILTANVKRDVDLSLYLVTGRDLLPPEMVPTFLFSFLLLRSFDLQSYFTFLEEVSNQFCPSVSYRDIRRLFWVELLSYRSAKRT